MPRRPSWLSSREAAALLAVKLETLYAYTSRGLIESVPGPRGRGRRYARESIERLKARHDARSGHAAVAAGALRFGEPTLETSISDIRSDGPWYRGHSALALCERKLSFEAVFDLLIMGQLAEEREQAAQQTAAGSRWQQSLGAAVFAQPPQLKLPVRAGTAPPSTVLAARLALAALTDDARHGASDQDEHARARRLTLWLADSLGGYAALGQAAEPRRSQRQALTAAQRRTSALQPARSESDASAHGDAGASRRQARRPSADSSPSTRADASALGDGGASRRQARGTRADSSAGARADASAHGDKGASRRQARGTRADSSAGARADARAAHRDGGEVRGTRADSSAGARAAPSVAERVLVALGANPDALSVELIDRTLILCAEHELNASTFAARVAASTGADLYACLGAALHTLSGVLHGGASARLEALLREIERPERAESVMRERHARGDAVPGFGQPLYPSGDPRGRVMCELAARAAAGKRRVPREYQCLVALADAMRRATHPGPNLDAGLVAVSTVLGLPAQSAAALFAIGRIPGWVAHALEQRAQHYILRPRARYVPGLIAPPAAPSGSISAS